MSFFVGLGFRRADQYSTLLVTIYSNMRRPYVYQNKKDLVNVPIYLLRRCYYTNTDAIIYVVDSADRYPHLHTVVS